MRSNCVHTIALSIAKWRTNPVVLGIGKADTPYAEGRGVPTFCATKLTFDGEQSCTSSLEVAMSRSLIGFRAGKAAQISAFFAMKDGGQIDKLKLSKLLYLSERESMAIRGRPMFYDEFFSLKDGPIASCALDGINQRRPEGVWETYVSKIDNDTISVKEGIGVEKLDELSVSDRDILEALWDRHGWMSATIIRRWTHDAKNCPEYVEVRDGRLPIAYHDIYSALGYENPSAMELVIEEYRSFEAVSQ